MSVENNRNGEIFAAIYYFVFIPSYAYVSFYAIVAIYSAILLLFTDLHIAKRTFQVLVIIVSSYYPTVLSVFLIWAFRFKSKIKVKQSSAIWLWIIGGILFVFFIIAGLSILFYYWDTPG
jgi:hypothetical protein